MGTISDGIPELAEKISSHKLPNIKVFCTAMGSQATTLDFHLNRNDQTSSLLRANCTGDWESYAEELQEVKIIQVPVTTLEFFMKENSIVEVDLLKIDTQGFDFEVIKGAGESIKCIKRILLEVQITPLYEGSGTKDEIVDYLTKFGFRLVHSTSQTDEMEENLEFIRVNRYSLNNNDLQYLDVAVPHVGIVSTPQNDLVGQLLEQRAFEGPELAFLWLYLRPGDTFFDCGAHAGIFSSVAAKIFNNHGFIAGFEPNKNTFELYKLNLTRLGCNCFQAFNIGLSDGTGTAELVLGTPGNSAYSTFAESTESNTRISDETTVVDISPLDEIMEQLNVNKVALAKLDVEGWESFVLSGTKKSIRAGQFPLWMIEFTEVNAVAAGSSTKELRKLIENFGYTLCRFDANNFRVVPETFKLEYQYENLFAVANIDQVNSRLSSAKPECVELARDIISRWDIAVKAREFDFIAPLFKESEADRADRLSSIQELSQKLEESEADRAARLSSIQELSQKLEESEADRAARLSAIQELSQKLEEGDARCCDRCTDRTVSLSVIEQLSQKLEESEADRTARLSMIEQISQKLEECEVDRAARLSAIDELSQKLEECEVDRAARLSAIDKLSKRLEESEVDRAARLSTIEQISQKLKESEADRANRLSVIQKLAQELEVNKNHCHHVEHSPIDKVKQQIKNLIVSLKELFRL
ncbi:MAG: FkbM family methyltransferase [Cyanobacteria bacterium J06639_18]